MPPARSSERLLPLFGMLAPLIVALAASTLLLVDYLRPHPVFCSEGGGCDRIKQTAFAHIAGIPTPVFGVFGCAVLGVLMLMRGPRVRTLLMAVATTGATMALFFMFTQWRLGTYCVYCMTVDTAMLVIFFASALRARAAWDPPQGIAATGGSVALLIAASAGPAAFGVTRKTPLPPAIEQEIAKTPPGMVTVVDFIDFECPFCRMTHEAFMPILAPHKDRIRLVRKQVPIQQLHPHAMDAARAAHCGEVLGQGDAMAEALVHAEPSALTQEGTSAIAVAVGLDQAAFDACFVNPKTDERIRADKETFKAVHGKGLPTIWVGEERLDGAQSAEQLSAAVATALARSNR